MRAALVVLLVASFGCKKKAGTPPSEGSGSAVVVVPADAAADAPAPDAAVDAAPPLGETVMTEDAIGGIKLGASGADVVKVLGEPTARSAPEEWAATGDLVSTWTWPGVAISMAKKDAGFIVLAIQVTAPSTLATSRGIRIGSTKAELEARYTRSTESAGDPNDYLVGSPYGGELFRLKDGKVASIFLGAMAE